MYYDRKTFDLSIPNYINKALACLHHSPTIKPQHSLHTYNAPIYGHKHQFFIPTITSEKLTHVQPKDCQELCGLSYYYARAIKDTMQTDFSAVASSLSTSSWKDIKFRINKFIDYTATHPNSKIRYHLSQINLWVHLDVSYLNESKACSRNGGFLPF